MDEGSRTCGEESEFSPLTDHYAPKVIGGHENLPHRATIEVTAPAPLAFDHAENSSLKQSGFDAEDKGNGRGHAPKFYVARAAGAT